MGDRPAVRDRDRPYNVAVSPDGRQLVVTEKSHHSTGFWDLEKDTERASIASSNRITHGSS